MPRPAWSTALRARRVALDLRQEDIAARTEDAISQGTISDLERGKVLISNLTSTRVSHLASALNWTVAEMQEALGIRLTAEVVKHGGYLINEVPASAVRTTTTTPRRALPEELEDMIRMRRDDNPELNEERWQQYLAGQRFGTGSVSAERWWRLYLLLKAEGIEPGGH
ncbi:helix-turn-helix domain-containing protein [Deinococcus sp. KSM4-11]|uniref:helix-turn-helix domain-containing protein n=1 Tax=Deinococcus sp. KSM4-11 TaxID=2568654 RepID=UPI001454B921|nr:helix-turn-helix transcriptional regulator [Deinococcus sp. KSM4-11]